ncbi:hypothetical protein MMC24_006633 [Lignoscripta atroalba]|nr:hypothetical protein [Lignoscripta atroalba]
MSDSASDEDLYQRESLDESSSPSKVWRSNSAPAIFENLTLPKYPDPDVANKAIGPYDGLVPANAAGSANLMPAANLIDFIVGPADPADVTRIDENGHIILVQRPTLDAQDHLTDDEEMNDEDFWRSESENDSNGMDTSDNDAPEEEMEMDVDSEKGSSSDIGSEERPSSDIGGEEGPSSDIGTEKGPLSDIGSDFSERNRDALGELPHSRRMFRDTGHNAATNPYGRVIAPLPQRKSLKTMQAPENAQAPGQQLPGLSILPDSQTTVQEMEELETGGKRSDGSTIAAPNPHSAPFFGPHARPVGDIHLDDIVFASPRPQSAPLLPRSPQPSDLAPPSSSFTFQRLNPVTPTPPSGSQPGGGIRFASKIFDAPVLQTSFSAEPLSDDDVVKLLRLRRGDQYRLIEKLKLDLQEVVAKSKEKIEGMKTDLDDMKKGINEAAGMDNAAKMMLQMGKMRTQLNYRGVEIMMYEKKTAELRKAVKTQEEWWKKASKSQVDSVLKEKLEASGKQIDSLKAQEKNIRDIADSSIRIERKLAAEALRREEAHFARTYEALQDRNQELMDSKDDMLENLRKQIGDLQQELESQKDTHDSQEAAMKAAFENSTTSTEKKRQEEHGANLTEMSSEYEKRLSSLRESHDKETKERTDDFEATKAEAQRQWDEMVKSKEDLVKAKEASDYELRASKEQSEKQIADLMNQLQRENEKVQQEYGAKLAEMSSEYEKRLSGLRESHDKETKERTDEFEAMKAEVQRKWDEMVKSKEDLVKAKEVSDNELRASKEQSEKQITDLENQLENQLEDEKVQQLTRRLRESDASKEDLEKEVENYRRLEQEQDGELHKLRMEKNEHIRMMNEKIKQNKHGENRITELTIELEEKKHEIIQAHKQTRQAQGGFDNRTKEIADIKQQLDFTREQLSKARTAKSAVDTKAIELENEITKLKSDNEAEKRTQMELAVGNQNLEKLKHELAGHADELEKVTKEKDKFEKENQKLIENEERRKATLQRARRKIYKPQEFFTDSLDDEPVDEKAPARKPRYERKRQLDEFGMRLGGFTKQDPLRSLTTGSPAFSEKSGGSDKIVIFSPRKGRHTLNEELDGLLKSGTPSPVESAHTTEVIENTPDIEQEPKVPKVEGKIIENLEKTATPQDGEAQIRAAKTARAPFTKNQVKKEHEQISDVPEGKPTKPAAQEVGTQTTPTEVKDATTEMKKAKDTEPEDNAMVKYGGRILVQSPAAEGYYQRFWPLVCLQAFLCFLMVIAVLCAIASTASAKKERDMWLGANELTRRNLLSLRAGGGSGGGLMAWLWDDELLQLTGGLYG